jgi:hypothetical protein
MTFGVDLFGSDAAGTVIWRRMCRFWDGSPFLHILNAHMEPVDPAPS